MAPCVESVTEGGRVWKVSSVINGMSAILGSGKSRVLEAERSQAQSSATSEIIFKFFQALNPVKTMQPFLLFSYGACHQNEYPYLQREMMKLD